ncbi:cyclic nucleotide-binding protein [Azorhizobium caulinodans ORS 571]|uniref:Cyclic nucleotide-binding protein n=1 Tax=Azorhizobium caulinodans (strain ATCC 43989 / DSM 5975 / JCM 20966 / LMG 6465 / NBRC 14845 / NCIMB 13405 / ORS 571) TaxID=438753 RepID=A8IGI1_AZOC5|nr:cyclic nucleotide-binding domain-containing protein [Azorhizobium caulinodans]BAF86089.1 cyclic nucleotide-binding protein [Azorhizobium caulinodans ORS 571]
MSLDQDVVLLQSVPTFRALSAEALRALAISVEERRLSPGEVLFRAGEPADCGYVVRTGRIEVFTAKGDRRAQRLEVTPGGLVGEMALILERPRPADAVAIDAATVLRIPRTTFLRVLESFPEAAVELRKLIAQRVETVLRSLDGLRDKLETPVRPPARKG